MRPRLEGLLIADPPECWEALGFAVQDSACDVGGVRIQLGAYGSGIIAWTISGTTAPIEGLPQFTAPEAARAEHPNGAIGVDHVVVTSPDIDRAASALEHAGMPLSRIEGRMGFRRLGPVILELVQAPRPAATSFWGLAFTIRDLDALASRLGDHLGPVRAAVQPGRRIATLSKSAALNTRIAFMDPEPE